MTTGSALTQPRSPLRVNVQVSPIAIRRAPKGEPHHDVRVGLDKLKTVGDASEEFMKLCVADVAAIRVPGADEPLGYYEEDRKGTHTSEGESGDVPNGIIWSSVKLVAPTGVDLAEIGLTIRGFVPLEPSAHRPGRSRFTLAATSCDADHCVWCTFSSSGSLAAAFLEWTTEELTGLSCSNGQYAAITKKL
ncbi:hypothetical protein EVG20_g8102 [Dentipellis fragilis]|uniref:Uncharacterized protein n=1 Tax=Dentipellis fragilis TaxID=205917 RepID=A0A4Y9YCI9_9AGAM|nr:hypothetical protein EVG20_g8102 [Dentipellis fragilis]